MIGDSLSGGKFVGNIVAMVMPITFAILVIIVRKYPNADMVPAMFTAGIFSVIYGLLIVSSLYISPKDLFLSFLLGVTQIGFGFICITIGSKSTPSAMVGILMLTEAILGPLWAWLFIKEVPPTSVLIGGGIIIFAILLQFFYRKKTT